MKSRLLSSSARRRPEPECHQLALSVEADLQRIADAIPFSPIEIASDTVAEPYPHLDARDYARMPRTLADAALMLDAAVTASRDHNGPR